MRVFIFATTLSLLAVVVACNSQESRRSGSTTDPATGRAPTAQTPQTAQPPQNSIDNARRITAEELHKLWQKDEVLIVDTRNEPSFKQGHIRGSILIPSNEFASRADELPKSKMIVTYCTWPAEQTSAGAVLTLKARGFQNAAALTGGLDAWRNAGYPVEKQP